MFRIDPRCPLPIYEQIVARVEEMILLGLYEKDHQLPSVRALAGDLAINPNTIQKAYGLLEQNGVIYSRQGRGSFVALSASDLKRRRLPDLLEGFRKHVRELKELEVSEEDLIAEVYRIYHINKKGDGSDDSSPESDKKL